MNDQSIFIPILLGTGRPNRQSAKAAEFVRQALEKRGTRTQVFDAGALTSRVTHGTWQPAPETEAWRQAAAQADGFIVVTPEYNHGYPGELKVVWDSCYQEYARKPVMICGASNGGLGGARVVEQFTQVVSCVHAVPLCGSVYFSMVDKLFNADGSITDPAVGPRLEKALDELDWFAAALKTARAAK